MIASNKNSDRSPKRISKRIQSRQTVHFDHEYNYADTRNCMLRVITFLNGLRPRLVKDLREEDRTCAICSEDFRDEISRSSHRPIELDACEHTFGEQCIRKWLSPLHDDACIKQTRQRSNDTSPLCRTRLFWGTCDFHDESLLGLYLKLRLWDRIYDRFQVKKSDLEESSRKILYRFVADEVLHNEGTITATDQTWETTVQNLEVRINGFAMRVMVKAEDRQSVTFLRALRCLKIVAGSRLNPGMSYPYWCFVMEHSNSPWSVDVLSVKLMGDVDQEAGPCRIQEAEDDDLYGEMTLMHGSFHDLNEIFANVLTLPRYLRIVLQKTRQSDGLR